LRKERKRKITKQIPPLMSPGDVTAHRGAGAESVEIGYAGVLGSEEGGHCWTTDSILITIFVLLRVHLGLGIRRVLFPVPLSLRFIDHPGFTQFFQSGKAPGI
jgi:hypothetical protein